MIERYSDEDDPDEAAELLEVGQIDPDEVDRLIEPFDEGSDDDV